MNPIKDRRETYSKWYEKHVTEVLVQFKDEDPAWIPESTLLAMQSTYNVIQN